MSDDPSRGGRTVESDSAVDDLRSTDSVSDPPNDADPVDDAVQRRLREAYLNDAENVLIVTAVRSGDDEIAVELRPPHGGTTHVERFPAPRDGSLSESESFLELLSVAGVSPLAVDELIGAEVPATYDPETGWRVADADASNRESGSRSSESRGRAITWLRKNRYWLLAGGLIVGELLFVVVIILLYT